MLKNAFNFIECKKDSGPKKYGRCWKLLADLFWAGEEIQMQWETCIFKTVGKYFAQLGISNMYHLSQQTISSKTPFFYK